MCGIAGFCNMPDNWQENITRMNDRIIHRGPDSDGIWASEQADVVLGHRRLAILDLSPAGAQPMVSASGRYVIVLNGEIYNFKEISKKLIKDGFVNAFRGTSDTEVLLEACEFYGFEETLKMATGMFAIALYDRQTRNLSLARDRLGEKPLYYGFLDGCFVFSSDIAAIRENLYFREELDLDALTFFLGSSYIPAPYTIYKNVRKLDAGCVLNLAYPYREPEIHKYWDIMAVAKNGRQALFTGTEEEAEERLHGLLKESVQRQMVADVPVGVFLSGGIDSTTVAAVMQSLSPQKVKTFSIGFGERAFNEADYAKETAQYLGTEHTELYVSEKEAQAVIPLLPYMYGEPFADASQIPTYLVSKLARESVTVSLTGDAGDELFCGYNTYPSLERRWDRFRRIPTPVRKGAAWAIEKGNGSKCSKLQSLALYLKAENPERVLEIAMLARGRLNGLVPGGSWPASKFDSYPAGYLKEIGHNLMLLDQQTYLTDDILVKVDRAGMAVSLETRIPLLDKDIIEFAWRLPFKYKYDGQEKKKILKNVLYRYVPKEMMDRPKHGFGIPVADWIRSGDLHGWAEDLLNEDALHRQGILDQRLVRDLWKQFLSGGTGRYIWNLLMFEAWYNACH